MKKVDLRKMAKGQDCQIRAPGCNFNPETTVLAHLGGAGMGLKKHDLFGAWACCDCHALVDGAMYSERAVWSRKMMHLEGVIRTQEKLIEMGVIHVGK